MLQGSDMMAGMASGGIGLIGRMKRKLAPRGVAPSLKLVRLRLERCIYRRKIDHRAFREALLSLGDWKAHPVWVQTSLNDFYNVQMRPIEIIEMMLDLVGPRGTLVMPAFPLDPDPRKELRIDTAPVSTGLISEMFRRLPDVRRSIHLNSSVVALGPDAEYITNSHHLGENPFGRTSPYNRLIERRALMICLGITGLGFTPLHVVECTLQDRVPAFEGVFRGKVTYAWRRRSGESGVHTTLVRHGRIHPARLIRHLPAGVLRHFRVSNLSFQAAEADELVAAVGALALRNRTIYLPYFK